MAKKLRFWKGQVVRLLPSKKLGEVVKKWRSYKDLWRVKVNGLDENIHSNRMRELNSKEIGPRSRKKEIVVFTDGGGAEQ